MYQIMLVEDEALVRESMAQNTNWEKFGFAPPHVFENGRQLPACREFSQIFLCLRNTENADLATAAENFLFPASPTYYG